MDAPDSEKASVFRACKRGAHLAYGIMVQPRSQSEDDKRRELILNIILSGALALLCFFGILILYNSIAQGSRYAGQSFFSFSIIILLFFGLLAASRKGHVRFSSYALVAILFAANTQGAYRWGISLPSCLLMYALIITISTLVVSNWFGLTITLLTSVVMISFRYLSLRGMAHPDLSWVSGKPQLLDAVKYAGFFSIMMLISWVSGSDTERSLVRARASEQALKEERDLLEIKVEERTRELRQAQAEKMSQLYRFAEFGRLSSGLFHDLINPLLVLAANMKNPEVPARQSAPALQKKLDQSMRASARIEQFLTVLKRQISSEDFQERFALNDAIEDALVLFSHKAMKAGVHLEFFAMEQALTCDNPLKFHQIVTNLVSNAIDACDETASGENARTEPERRRIVIRLEILRDGKNDRALITVADRGCGIPQSVIGRIFDPFFSTKADYKGMGLGLSTTKDIVEKHFRGTITVQSTEGEGTSFAVTIPLQG